MYRISLKQNNHRLILFFSDYSIRVKPSSMIYNYIQHSYKYIVNLCRRKNNKSKYKSKNKTHLFLDENYKIRENYFHTKIYF